MSNQVIYDTKRLQIAVLTQFMHEEHGKIFCGDGFVKLGNGVNGLDYTSFNKAVALFNNSYLTKENYGLGSVKLSYSKKSKQIKCLDHKLEFSEEFKEDGTYANQMIKFLRISSSGKKIYKDDLQKYSYEVSDK